MNKIKASHWFAHYDTLPKDTIDEVYEPPRVTPRIEDKVYRDETLLIFIYCVLASIGIVLGPIGFIIIILLIVIHYGAS